MALTVGESLIVLSGLFAIQAPSLCMSFCLLSLSVLIGTHTLVVHGQCLSCPKVLPCGQVRTVRTSDQASKGLTGKLVGRVWAYRVLSGSLALHKSQHGSGRLNSQGYVVSWGQPRPRESLRNYNQKKKKSCKQQESRTSVMWLLLLLISEIWTAESSWSYTC